MRYVSTSGFRLPFYVIWLDFAQSCTCQVYKKLGESVKDINGARMEDNKFCVSVHYRNVAEDVIFLYPTVYISYMKCSLGIFELNINQFNSFLFFRTIKRFSSV